MVQAQSGKSAISKGTNAQKVIDMYAALELKQLCDDDAIIAGAFAAKKPFIQQCLRSPDPAVLKTGEDCNKFGNLLQNAAKRSELLRIVFEFFDNLVETNINVGLAAGTLTTVTEELKANWREIARTQCNASDALAARWVVDYMTLHRLKDGDDVVYCEPVSQFTATPGIGLIKLGWVNPHADRCDRVEITREEAGGKNRTVVYTGSHDSFQDNNKLKPGCRYTYQAISYLGKVYSTPATAHAVCLAEVTDLKANWAQDGVALSWRFPGEKAQALIFRRQDGPPQVKAGAPADPGTKLAHRTTETGWKDTQVNEGSTYHYLVICDYSNGCRTQGVPAQIYIPMPPPAVGTLSARVTTHEGEGAVALEWSRVTWNALVEYVVVRREGMAAPTHVHDGVEVTRTKQLRCTDDKAVAGHRYRYAVFTHAGELFSRTGTYSAPVDILADIWAPVVRTGNETVEIDWQRADAVNTVIVRRGDAARPRDRQDGNSVKTNGTSSAKDEKLQNGICYYYRIWCAYLIDGETKYSDGMDIDATPDYLPDPVTDFTAEIVGKEVHCRWTAPAHGQVKLIRLVKPRWEAGVRFPEAELTGAGQPITTTAGLAKDTHPDRAQPYYTIVTVAGNHAITGGTEIAVVVPDVSSLQLLATSDGVDLRWIWPPGCTAVKIAHRRDGFPEKADDPKAVSTTLALTDYKRAGEKYTDRLRGHQGLHYYTVYAQLPIDAKLASAPGTAPDCRAGIDWQPVMTLHYRMVEAKGAHAGKAVEIQWDFHDAFPRFAGFVLVANQSHIPTRPDDGTAIFRWTSPAVPQECAQRNIVPLESLQRRGWAHFYVKLFTIESAQQPSVLIIHPDLNIAISDRGKIPVRRTYRKIFVPRKIPNTIICPQCLESFPLTKMQFGSYVDNTKRWAKYSLLNKLRGEGPQPPIVNGQRLTRKLCLNNHDLPFTAGNQMSEIIGLVGASQSGKTHYIATLIQRLEGQVGHDFSAALTAATTVTQQRYSGEFEPLFKNQIPLPTTVGMPSPLIYDFTMDGTVWQDRVRRAVTLTLYDTAGENLRDPMTVKETLKYLSAASGLLFLVDPLQQQEVRDEVQSIVKLPESNPAQAPNAIITNILQLLEGGKVIGSNQQLNIPIAVVLTKCDVLRNAGLFEPHRLWHTDKRHIGYFDQAAHEDMSGMVGAWMQQYCLNAYSTVSVRFSRHAFFAISSTGCSPDPEIGRYPFISPWRIEDPLLWLLAQIGVIPTR